MSQTQKHAYFSLVVIALTASTVIGLAPFLGKGATGGFSLLALLGFSLLFFRRKNGQVVADERDLMIQRNALIIAFVVFWLAFVAVAVVTPLVFHEEGAVPNLIVESFVWIGLMLFTSVQALATLLQYGKDTTDARA